MRIVLGVTIDLGWPWWVTTIIAVAVAAAAVVAFFVTRHPMARGVLATLAVQGVVLAAVAPALMDNGGDGSMSAMESSTQLTEAEYARQADANCASVYKFAATLGKPKTLPATANMLDRLLPAFWNAWLEQGLLQPPPEEQQVARRWMGAMRSYASSLEGVRHAAQRGDRQGVNTANALANRHAQDAGSLSSQLGMTVCFR
jgi:hypothetical protein